MLRVTPRACTWPGVDQSLIRITLTIICMYINIISGLHWSGRAIELDDKHHQSLGIKLCTHAYYIYYINFISIFFVCVHTCTHTYTEHSETDTPQKLQQCIHRHSYSHLTSIITIESDQWLDGSDDVFDMQFGLGYFTKILIVVLERTL